MLTVFEDFKTFVQSIGMSATANGELLVNNDTIILGDTTLNNVTVTGNLQVGLINIDTIENSIQTLGTACYNPESGIIDSQMCADQTLYLQKNLAGNLDFFNGKVTITPDGTFNIAGDLTADKIQANEFSLTGMSDVIGSSILPAGETSITIENFGVTENAKIFVTPTSPTGGQALVVSNKSEGSSFTVSVNAPYTSNITFDWWVLDVKK